MPVVTIAGRFGSPAREVGLEVAGLLGADYVDHQIIAQAATRSGASVEDLAQMDEQAMRGRDRLARFFQNFLEKSAAAGSAGDPFLGPTGIEVLMSRSMAEAAQPAESSAERLNDTRYIKVITEVIQDLARGGSAVLIGRGSNVILRDLQNALHVYIVSSLESRVEETMRRESVDKARAEKLLKGREDGRSAWYKKYFKVAPEDPTLYHIFLNSDRMGMRKCARVVVEAASELKSAVAQS